MASTIDPLVRYRPSPLLTDFADFLAESELDLPENLKNKKSTLLTADDIRWIYDRRGRISESSSLKDLHFHELLDHCEMVLPQPKFPPRNPVLEARIQRLRAEQEERDYKRMTENVDGRQGLAKQTMDDPIGKQMKELNNYLLIIVQFVISVICSFVFGYMGPYYMLGIANTGTRLLSGIMVGFIVAVADLYFVVKFMLEAEGLIEPNNIKLCDSQFAHKARKLKMS